MSSFPEDSARLLSLVPADGTAISNQRLHESLGWDENRYLSARQPLLDAGVLATGRGKGGSVRRPGPDDHDHAPAAPNGEMFPLEEVATSNPIPRRSASTMKEKALPAATAPVTTHQFTDATRKNIPCGLTL